MMAVCNSTPKPRQTVWGDAKAQEWVSRADIMEPVQCLDVCGCHSNVFMERTRPLPSGCPLDDVEPVFDDDGHYTRPLTDFEWLRVAVYEEFDGGWQDAPDLHRLYDGPHLYPLETVLFMMQDGFVTRSMIPWGWVPSHSRPAEDLHNAIHKVEEIWAELGESPKHMLLSLLGSGTRSNESY